MQCKFFWRGGGVYDLSEASSAAYNMSGDLLGSDESCFYKKEVNT